MSELVHPVADEAALRFLASEIERLQLMLAQTTGNLALANSRLAELSETTPEEVTIDPELEQ